MTEECMGCHKEYIVCTHDVCGDDKGGYIVTHSACPEDGCGDCMNRCLGNHSEDYCDDCWNSKETSGRADWYTYRMEMGFTE